MTMATTPTGGDDVVVDPLRGGGLREEQVVFKLARAVDVLLDKVSRLEEKFQGGSPRRAAQKKKKKKKKRRLQQPQQQPQQQTGDSLWGQLQPLLAAAAGLKKPPSDEAVRAKLLAVLGQPSLPAKTQTPLTRTVGPRWADESSSDEDGDESADREK